MVRTEESIDNTQTLAFVDDLFIISARKEWLQAKADMVSVTVVILGVRFVPAKLRTTAIAWGQDPSGYTNENYHLVVHDFNWKPIDIPVTFYKIILI